MSTHNICVRGEINIFTWYYLFSGVVPTEVRLIQYWTCNELSNSYWDCTVTQNYLNEYLNMLEHTFLPGMASFYCSASPWESESSVTRDDDGHLVFKVSFSIMIESYQDDGRRIMKDSVQRGAVQWPAEYCFLWQVFPSDLKWGSQRLPCVELRGPLIRFGGLLY